MSDYPMTKEICLPSPLSYDPDFVNVKEFLPIIDHPWFQLLKHKKQTGLLYQVFPNATHTRFIHSLGTLHLARNITPRLDISDTERRAVQVVALIHDWRHLPCSHDIEPLLPIGHNERGRRDLVNLYDAIENCDVPAKLVQEIYDETNPLHIIVKHGIYGSDKLDYTWRDSYQLPIKNAPAVKDILRMLVYRDGVLSVDKKRAQEAEELRNHYAALHKKAYFNSKYIIYKRMLQRAAQEAIEAGIIDPKSIIELGDEDMLGILRRAEHHVVAQLAKAIHNHDLSYHAVVSWRIKGYEQHEKDKVHTNTISKEKRSHFSKSNLATPQGFMDLENRLAEELGINPGDILVTTIFSFDKYRKPTDIQIHGDGKGVRALSDEKPDENHSYEKVIDPGFSIRVAAKPDIIEKVAKEHKKITEIVEEAIDAA